MVLKIVYANADNFTSRSMTDILVCFYLFIFKEIKKYCQMKISEPSFLTVFKITKYRKGNNNTDAVHRVPD